MHTEALQQLGLSKNEAKIYEVLVKRGILGVGEIAVKAEVNRRNVYDSMQRLLEKGLVFEVYQTKDVRYQAVEPDKLRSLIEEKEEILSRILPNLNSSFQESPDTESVFVYKGVEGWRNYMRDILRVGEDFYAIGARGAWWEPKLQHFLPQFLNEAKRINLNYYHLFDYQVKENNLEVLKHVGTNYKFLPKEYSTPASVDIFGDRVNINSKLQLGGVDPELSITVIVNPVIANAFRTWFKFMWDSCPK